MSNAQFNEELKQLSLNSYGENTPIPEGWQAVQSKNSKTGFQATIYKKGNDVAVIYRGTDTNQMKDFVNDVQMVLGFPPNQQKEADAFYENAKVMFPNANITVGGHSLGGSLAQIISAKIGVPAVTFNAYGTGDILSNLGYTDQRSMNITNYGNSDDIVFGKKYDRMPGRTFITNSDLNPDEKYLINNEGGARIPKKADHMLPAVTNLKDAVEVEPTKLLEDKQPTITLKGSVSENVVKIPFTREEIGRMSGEEFAANEKQIMEQLSKGEIQGEAKDFSGYVNPETGSGKIYTREDIGAMNGEEFAKNEKEIMAQMKSDVGIPTKDEMNAISASGDVVWVSDYTRDDGTGVKGYYRSKGK